MSAVPTPSPDQPAAAPVAARFTGYQKFVAGLLAFLQFAVILDFMVMAPLGAVIMPSLSVTPAQFGMIVSAYAFSAGFSGLLAAGFADRFDRKKFLLFFYIGFIAGTLWCGLAQSFHSLLAARIVTGLFGGVIGSVVLAIATDLFAPQLRGRVMAVIQTAFSASQVMGIPVALYLSNRFDWHAPFTMMVVVGVLGGAVLAWRLQPVTGHLTGSHDTNPLRHLFGTLTDPRHLTAFATTALLTIGGFMLMPFSSVFTVNNLHISLDHLPTIYLITGLCTIVTGPLIGKATDSFGKMPVFLTGSVLTSIMVLIYTHLGPIPLLGVVAVNVVMFVGIFSRMIPYQALAASVPELHRRGAFNAISASIQQLAGGTAAVVAGHLVSTGADGRLQGFPKVGYVVVTTTFLAALLVRRVNREVTARLAAPEKNAAG
jgi:predicted MFS family arabinose efflux permease